MVANEQAGLFYSVMTFLEAVNCILCLVALGSALSQKRTAVIRWLVPLTITHITSAVGVSLPLLARAQGHPVSVMQSMGLGFLTLTLSFVTTVCVLLYVVQHKH